MPGGEGSKEGGGEGECSYTLTRVHSNSRQVGGGRDCWHKVPYITIEVV